MADRGKPITIAMKLEIRRRMEEPVRKLAESLGLDKNTVHKYAKQFRTKLLQPEKEVV